MKTIILMVAVSGILILLWLCRDKHKWVYRNPYDRTCRECHQHEVKHCWDLKSWNRDWWEIFRDGDAGKCGNKEEA